MAETGVFASLGHLRRHRIETGATKPVSSYNAGSLFFRLVEYKESAVNLINLDAQGEAVKQFFLSLPVDPEGAVVELNGQALAHLMPIAAADNGHADDEE